jgi:hypothetical protein
MQEKKEAVHTDFSILENQNETISVTDTLLVSRSDGEDFSSDKMATTIGD